MMKRKILIFSGMPASGKDTVTDGIISTDPRFVALKKHKSVGSSDAIKDTYYNISIEEFNQKAKNGDFLQYHGRYGRYYGIDESVLRSLIEQDKIPVIHIGRIENYYAFIDSINNKNIHCNVVHIQLWNSREKLIDRIKLRDKLPEEIEKRISAMEQEFEDAKAMMERNEKPFTAVVRNNSLEETISLVISIVDGKHTASGYDEYWQYLREQIK